MKETVYKSFSNDLLCWIVSVVFVSLGQSAYVPAFSIGASLLGYACFWHVLFSFAKDLKTRFWVSVAWFSLVQAVHLSWMTSSEYMGVLIWVVFLGLIFVLGLQFGCLVFLFPKKRFSLLNCSAISSLWTLLEWSRLSFFSGFTWNPVGLSLGDSPYAIQWASVVGVYGLSFSVILLNTLALYSVGSIKRGIGWAFCAFFPYLFGFVQQEVVDRYVASDGEVKVALVQTAILPEQKDFFLEKKEAFIPFLDQWMRIWECLKEESKFDLIVLPEASVGAGVATPVYSLHHVQLAWERCFGVGSSVDLPVPKEPFAQKRQSGALLEKWRVSNGYIAQAIANRFQADVIAGFDDADKDKHYNAAFHFRSQSPFVQRYIKRVLVPVGEYIPLADLSWIRAMLQQQFGVSDSFVKGDEVSLCQGIHGIPIGVSICLEETYSELVRDLRLLGARLFVNVSNDVWFPSSSLPYQHFQHGRIRAAEHGVPVFRACNTGVTGAIDCFGRVQHLQQISEEKMGILTFFFNLRSFPTLYTWWGDALILSCSVFFLLLYSAGRLLCLKVWVERL